MPTMAALMLAELEREAMGTRRVLERVPEGLDDWRPHEKSMPLGYLAALVATMPRWAVEMIRGTGLDLGTAGPQEIYPTNRELLRAFDTSLRDAKTAFEDLTDEELARPWRLLSGGRIISEQPRHIALRDGFFNHLVHHRAQLTVYLRLNDRPVPALYGPSADEKFL